RGFWPENGHIKPLAVAMKGRPPPDTAVISGFPDQQGVPARTLSNYSNDYASGIPSDAAELPRWRLSPAPTALDGFPCDARLVLTTPPTPMRCWRRGLCNSTHKGGYSFGLMRTRPWFG